MLPKQDFKAKEKSQITCFEKEANFFIKNPAKTVSNGGKKYQNVAKLLPNLGFTAKEKNANNLFCKSLAFHFSGATRKRVSFLNSSISSR